MKKIALVTFMVLGIFVIAAIEAEANLIVEINNYGETRYVSPIDEAVDTISDLGAGTLLGSVEVFNYGAEAETVRFTGGFDLYHIDNLTTRFLPMTEFVIDPGEWKTVPLLQFWGAVYDEVQELYVPPNPGDFVWVTGLRLNWEGGSANFSSGGPGSYIWQGLVERSAPTDPVPEPATMILFGSGLVGLLGVQRKRRKNK